MKFTLFLALTFTALNAYADLSPVTLVELAGNWKAACAAQNGGSVISQLNFTAGGEVTDQVLGYSDANCGALYFTEIAKLDFSINAGGLSATASPFDAVLEFDSAAAIIGANQANSCGMSNWEIGVQKTIIGTNCFLRDVVNLQLGKIDANTLRVIVCDPSNAGACQTMDYVRLN